MTTSDLADWKAQANRACDACSQRKSRCDKARPACNLCLRTGRVCEYPLKRKPRISKKPRRDQQLDGSSAANCLSLRALKASTARVADRATGIRRDVPANARYTATHDSQAGDTSSWRSNHNSDDNHPMSPLDTLLFSSTEWQNVNPVPNNILPSLAGGCAESALSCAPDDASSMVGGVSSDLAVELVELFFEKVQPWLPMLHRPRFHHKYHAKLRVRGSVMKGMNSGEALLVYGIFALSARFSNHIAFQGISDSDKGSLFAEKATEIYIKTHLVQQPPLLQLQGYLLLAHHQQASGPTILGRILVGQCLQIAYTLGLHDMDDPVRAMRGPAVDYVEREEMRRAWWLLWELDTFASCASGNPFLIDRRRISVMLPISDEAWFAMKEVASAELITDPGQSWKCLENSPNQDERAWNLVAIHMMATALDRLRQSKALSVDEKLAMQNEIACFKLALPVSASLDSQSLKVNQSSIARHNWVIAIHLILMTISFMVDGVAASEHGKRTDPKVTLAAAGRRRAATLSRIIQLWDPTCIDLAQPFIMCAMIPALPMHKETDSMQLLISSTNDMAVLVLKRFRSKWKLGDIMLEISNLRKNPDFVNAAQNQLSQRYALFFRKPRARTGKGISKLAPDDAETQSQNQIDADPSPSYPSLSHQDQDSPESTSSAIASATIRPDPFEYDWTGWPYLATDPLGFPAVQPDLYDFGFDVDTQNVETSNLMQLDTLQRG